MSWKQDKEIYQRQVRAMENAGWHLRAEIHPACLTKRMRMMKGAHGKTHDIEQIVNHNGWVAVFLREKAREEDGNGNEVAKPNYKKHRENEFYHRASAYRESIRAKQIDKGAEKYENPFDASDWSDEELGDHAMMENVDQAHYIVGLMDRNKAYKELLIEAMDHMTEEIAYLMSLKRRIGDEKVRHAIQVQATKSNDILLKMAGMLK